MEGLKKGFMAKSKAAAGQDLDLVRVGVRQAVPDLRAHDVEQR